ncbi:MAG: hypothetical protein F6J95_001400 [Leptolyngbya sp. SIO1E4]|nr:hypothetical protein [Leptolyngbya sp. SIO1E4]
MASDMAGLLSALKQWKKGVKKLKKKGVPAQTRTQAVEQARQAVLDYLAADPIADELDELIQRAVAPDSPSVKDVRETLVKHPHPIVAVELKTVQPLAVSHKDLETLIGTFLQTPDEEKPIASTQELKDMILHLSLVIPQEYQAATELSRKPKKRRKRDLTLGTLQTALGLGLLAGNSQLESAIAGYSYILGGNALILAMQNLVGTLKTQSDHDAE